MDQHLRIILVSLTSIMLLAYWFNYCMGTPLNDDPKKVDVGAIFFFLPLRFADRRLKRAKKWREYKEALLESWAVTQDPIRKEQLYKDHLRDRYDAGRTFFTWERSILCPICLHWWLTVILVGVFVFTFALSGYELLLVAFTYLVNHFIIRKI